MMPMTSEEKSSGSQDPAHRHSAFGVEVQKIGQRIPGVLNNSATTPIKLAVESRRRFPIPDSRFPFPFSYFPFPTPRLRLDIDVFDET